MVGFAEKGSLEQVRGIPDNLHHLHVGAASLPMTSLCSDVSQLERTCPCIPWAASEGLFWAMQRRSAPEA